MKIVRLKKGYRLNVSDAEFEALRELLNAGSLATVETADWVSEVAPVQSVPQKVVKVMQSMDIGLTVSDDRR